MADKFCEDCGDLIHYGKKCSTCRYKFEEREHKRHVERMTIHYYEVVFDPSDYPLNTGLRLSAIEVAETLRFGNFTDGTRLVKDGVKFLVKGKKLVKEESNGLTARVI